MKATIVSVEPVTSRDVRCALEEGGYEVTTAAHWPEVGDSDVVVFGGDAALGAAGALRQTQATKIFFPGCSLQPQGGGWKGALRRVGLRRAAHLADWVMVRSGVDAAHANSATKGKVDVRITPVHNELERHGMVGPDFSRLKSDRDDYLFYVHRGDGHLAAVQAIAAEYGRPLVICSDTPIKPYRPEDELVVPLKVPKPYWPELVANAHALLAPHKRDPGGIVPEMAWAVRWGVPIIAPLHGGTATFTAIGGHSMGVANAPLYEATTWDAKEAIRGMMASLTVCEAWNPKDVFAPWGDYRDTLLEMVNG